MRSQIVRIKTVDLVAALQRHVDTAQEAYVKEKEAYAGRVGHWNDAVADRLEEYAQEIRNGANPTQGGGWASHHIDVPIDEDAIGGKPQLPTEPRLEDLKNQIALLRMCADETIAVNTDSPWVGYLKETKA